MCLPKGAIEASCQKPTHPRLTYLLKSLIPGTCSFGDPGLFLPEFRGRLFFKPHPSSGLLSLLTLPQVKVKHSTTTYPSLDSALPGPLSTRWLSPIVSTFHLLPACSLQKAKYNHGLAGVSSPLTRL